MNDPVAAIDQLGRSERGAQVLRDLHAMIENGAISLDSSNWWALGILVEHCRKHGATEIRDAIAYELRLA